MTAKVRPTIGLRLFTGLVIAPVLLLGGLVLVVTVVLPALFPGPISLRTFAIVIGVAALLYSLLYLAFEMDLVSEWLALYVGNRWAHKIERSKVLRFFFSVEKA